MGTCGSQNTDGLEEALREFTRASSVSNRTLQASLLYTIKTNKRIVIFKIKESNKKNNNKKESGYFNSRVTLG